MEILITEFTPEDQVEARALVLAGLEERWGWLDLTKNPDLDDIQSSYRGGIFLVARNLDGIVGTGALMPRGADAAEIMRMSVARQMRRCGLGKKILNCLIAQARQAGIQRIVLETTSTWEDAVAFYLHAGFHITHYQDGDVYFEKPI